MWKAIYRTSRTWTFRSRVPCHNQFVLTKLWAYQLRNDIITQNLRRLLDDSKPKEWLIPMEQSYKRNKCRGVYLFICIGQRRRRWWSECQYLKSVIPWSKSQYKRLPARMPGETTNERCVWKCINCMRRLERCKGTADSFPRVKSLSQFTAERTCFRASRALLFVYWCIHWGLTSDCWQPRVANETEWK